MTYTEDVAAYVASTRFEALPASVIAAARRVTLDLLGVIYPAAAYGPATIMNEYVRSVECRPRATVVGTDIRTSTAYAALANGTMAAEMEQDDVHQKGTHPSSVYVPALLAVAEDADVSGREWVTALVCAYDVGIRVNTAMDLARQYSRGFHPTSVSGTFGATAGVARLLKLDQASIIRAFGLTGCQAGGLLTWEMEPEHYTKSFQSGVPARNAVTAVELAKRGYIGAPDTLDGTYNIFDAFSTHRNFEPLTAGLGQHYEIEHTTYKFHSCCRAIHTTLDIIFELRDIHGFTAADVDGIDVQLIPSIVSLVDNNVLTTHNLQFVVAAGLIDGMVSRAQTAPARRVDPSVNRLASRVTLSGDRELEVRHPESGVIDPANVTVRLRDGRRFTVERDTARGSTRQPVSYQEIEQKFRLMTTTRISAERAESIVQAVRRLESLASIRELTSQLRVP